MCVKVEEVVKNVEVINGNKVRYMDSATVMVNYQGHATKKRHVITPMYHPDAQGQNYTVKASPTKFGGH